MPLADKAAAKTHPMPCIDAIEVLKLAEVKLSHRVVETSLSNDTSHARLDYPEDKKAYMEPLPLRAPYSSSTTRRQGNPQPSRY